MTMSNGNPDAIRVGVIGAGLRASGFFRDIPEGLEDAVQIAALADPDPDKRAGFGELIAVTQTDPHTQAAVAKRWAPGAHQAEYSDGLELLAKQRDLDALIVATPNSQHVPYAVEAMSQSLPLMLEKPVATSVEDLAALWRADHAVGGSTTLVGFVLRYTPFYSKIREIVQSGRLGTILSVEANENLATPLTKRQYRGWRQDTGKSGGWMVEKCCHDFDILSHLLDSRPTRVFSMASAQHFRPRPEEEQLRRFQIAAQDGEGDSEELRDTMQHSPYSESNLPDRQVATLEFANGVYATFTATMAQPRTTRRIRIFGTEGMLEGSTVEKAIRLQFPDPAGGRDFTEEHLDIAAGSSGHSGGDAVLNEAFWKLAAGRGNTSRAGLAEGIDAVLTALAVQSSAASGQPVDLAELRSQVYG